MLICFFLCSLFLPLFHILSFTRFFLYCTYSNSFLGFYLQAEKLYTFSLLPIHTYWPSAIYPAIGIQTHHQKSPQCRSDYHCKKALLFPPPTFFSFVSLHSLLYSVLDIHNTLYNYTITVSHRASIHTTKTIPYNIYPRSKRRTPVLATSALRVHSRAHWSFLSPWNCAGGN